MRYFSYLFLRQIHNTPKRYIYHRCWGPRVKPLYAIITLHKITSDFTCACCYWGLEQRTNVYVIML
uniref:Uncharacterized protein n=2 Tax=Glycine subgen. Soja TaxID=1462606 RepID=A0A0R0EKL4_SOYBN